MLSGCGRPIPNEPMANSEAANAIRLTLVSNSSAGGAAGGGDAQAKAKSTGWGTIKGRFVYDGAPPTPPALNIDKDQAVCGGHNLVNESLLVSSDGGLQNAVLLVKDRNVDVHPDYDATKDAKVTLDNHNCHFEPHIAVVRAGQTLVVKNSDTVSHNTNAGLQTNGAFNDSIPAGTELTKKIGAAETTPAPVNCTIHPWMKGYIIVQPHPYVAVSGKDGTFEIKNVPAGVPLKMKAWHEASTASGNALQANRPDLKWQTNGEFTVTLQPDQVLDLKEIKVPASSLAAK